MAERESPQAEEVLSRATLSKMRVAGVRETVSDGHKVILDLVSSGNVKASRVEVIPNASESKLELKGKDTPEGEISAGFINGLMLIENAIGFIGSSAFRSGEFLAEKTSKLQDWFSGKSFGLIKKSSEIKPSWLQRQGQKLGKLIAGKEIDYFSFPTWTEENFSQNYVNKGIPFVAHGVYDFDHDKFGVEDYSGLLKETYKEGCPKLLTAHSVGTMAALEYVVGQFVEENNGEYKLKEKIDPKTIPQTMVLIDGIMGGFLRGCEFYLRRTGQIQLDDNSVSGETIAQRFTGKPPALAQFCANSEYLESLYKRLAVASKSQDWPHIVCMAADAGESRAAGLLASMEVDIENSVSGELFDNVRAFNVPQVETSDQAYGQKNSDEMGVQNDTEQPWDASSATRAEKVKAKVASYVFRKACEQAVLRVSKGGLDEASSARIENILNNAQKNILKVLPSFRDKKELSDWLGQMAKTFGFSRGGMVSYDGACGKGIPGFENALVVRVKGSNHEDVIYQPVVNMLLEKISDACRNNEDPVEKLRNLAQAHEIAKLESKLQAEEEVSRSETHDAPSRELAEKRRERIRKPAIPGSADLPLEIEGEQKSQYAVESGLMFLMLSLVEDWKFSSQEMREVDAKRMMDEILRKVTPEERESFEKSYLQNQ